MITKELINVLVKQCNADSLADDLYSLIKTVQDIETKIRLLRNEIANEKKKYEEKQKEINKKIAEIQNQCQHWTTTYNVDISGNNDYLPWLLLSCC